MISKILTDEMNIQVNKELYSSYLYLSMAAYFESANLTGFAHWMRVQSQEELDHGRKFYNYLLDRGGKVVLAAIDAPPVEFASPLAALEMTYEHEKMVTARINHIYSQAVKENDYACQVFLNWFVNEQVEEEKNASQIVEVMKMIGDKSNAIFQLDHQMGKRGSD
jgi:ferritin